MSLDSNKVLLAMSGGVDSSVAAAVLRDAGYEVTGVFMCLGSAGSADGTSRGCCSPQDAADARRVANALGIELYVLDMQEQFAPIIDYFVNEYAQGRTPNPCIPCNARIKFGRILERADSLGVQYVATGHHARLIATSEGPAIARARSRSKDQSYALFAVKRENLSRILLPIGEIEDKRLVRRLARQLNLAVHDKDDSQEICFVPNDDYVAFLRERTPEVFRGGEIVNSSGEVLGQHEGYAQYTIGQRRGLGVAVGEPMYVTHIDPASARVTIGTLDEARRRFLRASGANWHADVEDEFDALVQIRYNHAGAPARVRITGCDTFEVEFTEDVLAVAPGQGAVVYQGARLLGGGWIERD